MHLVSPIIVTLRSSPELGEGIVVGGETYLDIAKDEKGQIVRDENGGPMMVKKRDMFVYWPKDPSEIFIHQLADLVPIEVVAVRTLDEMKQEVIQDVLDELEADDEDEEGSPEEKDDTQPA